MADVGGYQGCKMQGGGAGVNAGASVTTYWGLARPTGQLRACQ